MPSAALTTRELVAKINRLHSEIVGFARTSLQRGVEIGELLSDAKAALEYGKWTLWAETNLKFSLRTAHNYIKLFTNCQVGSDAKFAELSVVYKSLASENGESKPSKNKPETPPKKGEKQLDSTGYPITAHALEFWNRKPEVQALLTAVSKLRSTIRSYRDSEDQMLGPLFDETDHATSLLHSIIQNWMPYAVCLECQGRPPDRGCAFCRATGLISKWKYEVAADQGKRRIREKSNEQSAA